MVCIREQPEAETFFGAELLVSGFILNTHAEDDRVFLLILPEVALEIVCFFGAPAGEVLGIEIEHHPFAAEVAQTESFSILGIQRKVRRGRP